MKESIILILKGFIMGIANIIPGISGGTLAITLGIYEKLINTISHFTKNIKENIKFILLLGIGMVISIGLFSNIIGYCLDKFPFATILFFIGFILGGMPILFKKVKGKLNISNAVVFLITFGIVIAMTFAKTGNNIVSLEVLNIGKIIALFLCGLIAAATMVLPGISGSFVLMLFGYYKPIVDTISELTKLNNLLHNLIILTSMGVGILFGVVLAAKGIEWLLKKYEIKTYYGIIGFVIASIISIFITAVSDTVLIGEIIVGIVLLVVGIFLSKMISVK